MRVLTWNCKRAHCSSHLWEYFRSFNADLALLQEVGTIPEEVSAHYSVRSEVPITKAGNYQEFRTVLLARGTLGRPLKLQSHIPWVNMELDRFSGNVFGNEVDLETGHRLHAINVHNPAWHMPKERWLQEPYEEVKLKLNPNIWAADLLWHALSFSGELTEQSMIVGGDFNTSETFDLWNKGRPRGNREYLDRMAGLGLTECLRHHNGHLVPTFKNLKDGSVTAQIDHFFVASPLAQRLANCTTGDSQIVFGTDRTPAMSDHLPIIADFY